LYDVQAEQELSELTYQYDEMYTRLEEADGMTSAQVWTLLTLLLYSLYTCRLCLKKRKPLDVC